MDKGDGGMWQAVPQGNGGNKLCQWVGGTRFREPAYVGPLEAAFSSV